METFLRVGLGNAAVAALLALGAASVGVFAFAQRRPALRHGLWLLVLLKLVTPPLWTVPVAWFAEPAEIPQPEGARPVLSAPPELDLLPADPADTDTGTAASAPAPWPASVAAASYSPARFSWGGLLVVVWVVGSFLTFGVAAYRVGRFQRLLRLAGPAPAATRSEVQTLAGRLGLGLVPEVWQVPGAVSPMLWALGGRPRLIVPRTLWDRLDQGQRSTLLAHELAHLKRRDHWVRCLELLVTGLYWWLPVVWIARHALREAEEQCCDAWVVWAFPDAIRTYAEALLETLDFLAGAGPAVTIAVAASGLGPVHHLKRRMTMIMQGTTPRALTWSGLLAVLGLSATMLPLSPTWAQRPEGEETPAPAAAGEKRETRDADPRPARVRKEDEKSVEIELRSDDPPAASARAGRGLAAPKARVRTFLISPGQNAEKERDEAIAKAMEQVRAAIGSINEKAAKRGGEPWTEREREELQEAVKKMQNELMERVQVKISKADQKGDKERPEPEDDDDDRAADKRRAEVNRLQEQVNARRKSLIEAEMQLAKAKRALGEDARVTTRNERFEFRIAKPGQTAAKAEIKRIVPGDGLKLVPRPDQDRRIAELEERLERLQNEVKSLKKDEPARR